MLDRIVYWLFRLTILLMRPLPLRVGYFVAGHVAVLCSATIFRTHRKALARNLARVLDTGDAQSIDAGARRSFRNFGKYVIDFIHFPSMTRDEVRGRLRFDEFEALNEVAASGRGALIVTLHFGNWDLGGAALAAFDYPINAIAETFRYGPMNDLVQGSRTRLGMKIIDRAHAGTAVIRCLRRGEMLAMLIDVASEDAGAVSAEFFGAPARVSSAPARIALRTGAWVLPAVVLRGPNDDLVIRPAIDWKMRDFAPSGDEAADIEVLTALILRALEPLIRAQPDQWFIFESLWGDVDGSRTRLTAAAGS